MKRVILIAVVACLFLSMTAMNVFAYENGDFQFWNSDSIEVKITDPLKAKVEQEFRFVNDMSELAYLHTDGGLYLKVTDGLIFAVNARCIDYAQGDYFSGVRPAEIKNHARYKNE